MGLFYPFVQNKKGKLGGVEAAGLGIAMGNASDELKATADLVVADGTNHGVAAAGAALERGPEGLGGAAPLGDWTSMKHETQYTRLVRS